MGWIFNSFFILELLIISLQLSKAQRMGYSEDSGYMGRRFGAGSNAHPNFEPRGSSETTDSDFNSPFSSPRHSASDNSHNQIHPKHTSIYPVHHQSGSKNNEGSDREHSGRPMGRDQSNHQNRQSSEEDLMTEPGFEPTYSGRGHSSEPRHRPGFNRQGPSGSRTMDFKHPPRKEQNERHPWQGSRDDSSVDGPNGPRIDQGFESDYTMPEEGDLTGNPSANSRPSWQQGRAHGLGGTRGGPGNRMRMNMNPGFDDDQYTMPEENGPGADPRNPWQRSGGRNRNMEKDFGSNYPGERMAWNEDGGNTNFGWQGPRGQGNAANSEGLRRPYGAGMAMDQNADPMFFERSGMGEPGFPAQSGYYGERFAGPMGLNAMPGYPWENSNRGSGMSEPDFGDRYPMAPMY